MHNLNQTLVFYRGGVAAAMTGEIKSYITLYGVPFVPRPNFS